MRICLEFCVLVWIPFFAARFAEADDSEEAAAAGLERAFKMAKRGEIVGGDAEGVGLAHAPESEGFHGEASEDVK